MPLIQCSKCKAMISSHVLNCPKCGHPVGAPASDSPQNNSISWQNSVQQQQVPYQQPQPQPQTGYNSNNSVGADQPQSPYQTGSQYGHPNPNYEDKSSTGLNILSFFIPIVGWILYFVHRKEKPIKAKECAKWGWIGFGVNMLLTIIL